MALDFVSAFHCTANLQRSDIFDDDALTPLTALEDANTAAAGWVGRSWREGTLLIGINPGGGGDDYRRNPTDDQLYEALRSFKAATDEQERNHAFRKLSDLWMRTQKGHNIWRIIHPILAATGETENDIAFMNIVPFRTRMDKMPPVGPLKRAWEKAASPQVLALCPRRIIALGKKSWDVLSRFEVPVGAELILFKRGIGDSYIPAESQAILRALAARREQRQGG